MWNNFWNLRVNERLTQWKNFRQQIGEFPLAQAVQEVNKLWSSAPFVNFYIEPSSPQTWPDPWTLLAENYYCDVAKALGIVYTLYFSKHQTARITIKIYYDYTDKSRYNLVWIENGKYILNYYPHEIVNTELIEDKKLQILYEYSVQDLELNKY